MSSIETVDISPETIIQNAVRSFIALIIGDEGSWDIHYHADTTSLKIIRSTNAAHTDVTTVESVLVGITDDVIAAVPIASMQIQRTGGYTDKLENSRTTTLEVTIPLTAEDFCTLYGHTLQEFVSQCQRVFDTYQARNPPTTAREIASSQNLRVWGDQLEEVLDPRTTDGLELHMTEWIGPNDMGDTLRISTTLEVIPVAGR